MVSYRKEIYFIIKRKRKEVSRGSMSEEEPQGKGATGNLS